jgi:predicted RNA binding protein with dsRBD fold (UPF0201 family)
MVHITARTPCHPTEDREKVRTALLNIFPEGQIEELDEGFMSSGDSGERLRQMILDEHIRDTARSVMLRGMLDGRTTFRLNKQVAYVGKLSFQEGSSPLGNIEVTVEDEDIKAVIDHLAESTVEGAE